MCRENLRIVVEVPEDRQGVLVPLERHEAIAPAARLAVLRHLVEVPHHLRLQTNSERKLHHFREKNFILHNERK